MADFDEAHKFVEKWEGGFSNDPLDLGGETAFGISRVHHPNWDGWGLPLPERKEAAKNFYRQEFWNRISGSQIESQRLATTIYQAAVNCGTIAAVKWLQNTLNAFQYPVLVDGIIGSETLLYLKIANERHLENYLVDGVVTFQKAHYFKLSLKNGGRFLKGWLNRANAC